MGIHPIQCADAHSYGGGTSPHAQARQERRPAAALLSDPDGCVLVPHRS